MDPLTHEAHAGDAQDAVIPVERIAQSIYLIRGEKVMFITQF